MCHVCDTALVELQVHVDLDASAFASFSVPSIMLFSNQMFCPCF